MNLLDKLKEDTILLPLQSSTQAEAIRELLVHLQKLKVLSTTRKLFSNITNKEELLSSAAGRGIAYPHSLSMEVNELVCVLGISKNGIDFNSPDRQLCHLILMTLSPDEDPSEHRKFITRFRTMCNNPDIRFDILDAQQNNNIIDIIQKWEENEAQIDDIS